MHSLRTLGLRADHREALDRLDPSDLFPGRVAAVHRDRLDLITATGDARGLLPDEPVAVGDWLALEDPGGGLLRPRAVLPRAGVLQRKAAGRTSAAQLLAANIDVLLVVTAVGHEFSARRLERYLAVAHAAGVPPVVVLNKIDLDPAGLGRHLRAIDEVAPGVDHAMTSALTGGVPGDLAGWLGRGRTLALLGSSGVGKSTLANALLGEEVQATGAVREADHKGRHTTTVRELLVMPDDRGLLIDTPGMRELGLASAGGLGATFADLESLAESCRFRDCAHDTEPDCAVLAAIAAGELSEERLASWHKLQREAAWQERRNDARAQREASREWARTVREVKRMRRAVTGRWDE